MKTNEATGEVTAEFADGPLKLHALMPRVAALQSALNVTGLRGIEMMLRQADARAIYHGVKCLCDPSDAPRAETLQFGTEMTQAAEAILAAIAAGMPKADDDDADEDPPGNA